MKTFSIIVADPPWSFKTYSKKGMSRSAENHYDCMSTESIARLKPPASKDCLLLLWATSPMLQEALLVMASWGFKYKSSFVWDKQIIGTGYWARNQHEFVLIGTRGQFRAPAYTKRRSSVISERRTRHSQKPEALQDWVDSTYPTKSKLEMFARRRRKGWAASGNEI